MDYLSIAQARERDGLRLVLTAGHPGPWGEAAKALFRVKGLDFTPVRQEAGGENAELKAWTGLSNAPVAVYDGEAPRSHWMDMIYLAERLAPEPALVPVAVGQRMHMFGLLRELAGDLGFAWYRRIALFQPLMEDDAMRPLMENLARRYGYSEQAAEIAPLRCAEVLALLSEQLMAQRERGSRFFIGDTLSALDLYWAAFSNMLRPLPPEQAPISERDRAVNTCSDPHVMGAAHPLLFEHRDRIWSESIGLPMDF